MVLAAGCISRENIYNTYDTRRLLYVGDPCRVDNGFDQPSGYGLGVGKAELRGNRLSELQERNNRNNF